MKKQTELESSQQEKGLSFNAERLSGLEKDARRNSVKVAILGASLESMFVASELEANGIDYIIIDKASEVGGDIKTGHCAEGFCFDLQSAVELESSVELAAVFGKVFGSEDAVITVQDGVYCHLKGKLYKMPIEKQLHEFSVDDWYPVVYDLLQKQTNEQASMTYTTPMETLICASKLHPMDSTSEKVSQVEHNENSLRVKEELKGEDEDQIVKTFYKNYLTRKFGVDAGSLALISMKELQRCGDGFDASMALKIALKKCETAKRSELSYPKNSGFQTIIKKMYKDLPARKKLCGAENQVIRINQKDRTILLKNEVTLSYRYIINTFALDRFNALCDELFDPLIFDYLGSAGILYVGIGFEGTVPDILKDKLQVLFSEPESPFYELRVIPNTATGYLPDKGARLKHIQTATGTKTQMCGKNESFSNPYYSLLLKIAETNAPCVDTGAVHQKCLDYLVSINFLPPDASVVAFFHHRVKRVLPYILNHAKIDYEVLHDSTRDHGIYLVGPFATWTANTQDLAARILDAQRTARGLANILKRST